MSFADQEVRDIEIQTSRLSIAARQWGNPQGSPVLALHGWLDNAASFDRLLPWFDLERYHVVALDLPGHGLSQHRAPGENYHLLENVIDIVEAIDQLGWSCCTLLGHSMGGALAMLVSGALPERVSQLVAIDALGPMVNPEEDTPSQLRKAVQRYLKGSSGLPLYSSFEEAVEARRRGVGSLSADAAALIAQRNLKETEGGYTWRTDPRLRWPSLSRLSEAQAQAALSQIECRTLLIAGEDGFFKPNQSLFKSRVGRISNVQVEFVEGGHHLHIEPNPQKVARVIMEFLNRNVQRLD